MSDALSAASVISGQLSAYRMIDGMREARARRDYENEVAYFKACNQWLNEALDREIAERNRMAADYERRIANLEAKYKERDARAVYDEQEMHEKYNRLVERFNDLLARYKALRGDTDESDAG